MMKRYKVKHYRSRIYNPVRGKILKSVLIGVIVFALFGIGWFAYEPLMEAINEKNKEIIQQDPVPEKEKEPVFEPLPVEFLDKGTVAVTVPEEYLYDDMEFYNFVKDLGEEVTAVVIDMKTKEGTVTYISDQVSVANAGASSETAYSLERRIRALRNMGFDIIARIYAFEDSTAPYNASDMAIRYESSEGVLWLDDSVDNGGKPWLNPYSDTAQKYILDIVYDAIDGGVDAILLEGVRFPDEEENMDYAYFGVGAEGVSRDDILAQFTKRIYSSAVITDTDIIIGYDAFEIFTGSDIYGESPLVLSADGFAPYIDLNDYVGKKYADDFYYKNMPSDKGKLTELFTKVYENIGEVEGLKVVPVMECKGFEKAQFTDIIRHLEEKEVSGYIFIYNEAYFTGIPEEPEEEEQPVQPSNPVTPPQQQQQPQQQPQQPSQPTQPETSEIETETGDEGENPGIVVKDYT